MLADAVDSGRTLDCTANIVESTIKVCCGSCHIVIMADMVTKLDCYD